MNEMIKFSNTIFDLVTNDLTELEILENPQKNNCFIRDKTEANKYYSTFIFDSNSKTKIVCTVTFYKSSQTNKYLPRLVFKKTDLNDNDKEQVSNKAINISFTDSKSSINFWKFISFLGSFKDLVETGEFENIYKVLSKKDNYFIEFVNKSDKDKISELKELILKSDIKETDIKSIVFENRKKVVNRFLSLLKNTIYKEKPSIDLYKTNYSITGGDEALWHHFLKSNDWILGLNVDIKFINEFYDEQKVGIENSLGKGSPKTDLLGISDYTTLIELKHSNTQIFKKEKTNKSRANTWDFSNDFIEGISQCLGQKSSIEKSFETKQFINKDGDRLDKNKILTIDPKTIFIIGCKKKNFLII